MFDRLKFLVSTLKKRFRLNVLASTSIGSTIFIMAINHSEEYRMAYLLKRGDYGYGKAIDFSPELCGYFDEFDQIDDFFESPSSFVGLVGEKGTGKTTTLQYKATRNREKSIYLEVDPTKYTSVTYEIYAKMYEPLWKLPWLMRSIRLTNYLSHKTIVNNVFGMATKDGERIRVYIDINLNEDSCEHESVTTSRYFDSSTLFKLGIFSSHDSFSTFTPGNFVREIKFLVQDQKLINCLFTSSEGLMFEAESKREERLTLFRLNELSMKQSEIFLEQKYGITPNVSDNNPRKYYKKEQLHRLPRTFHTLIKFAKANDREKYVIEINDDLYEKIRQSIFYPHGYRWQDSSITQQQKVLDLYKLALTRDITVEDIIRIGGMSPHDFVKAFVVPNIFRSSRTYGHYTLQFDATYDVVRKVLEKGI